MTREAKGIDHPDFPHNTNAGYQRKCRCSGCKAAHSKVAYKRWLKNRPEARQPYRKHGGDITHPDFPHGESAGYIAGCRCESCIVKYKEAFRIYIRKYRALGTLGGIKKAKSNAAYRKSEKGLISSRKGNATRAARKRNAVISTSKKDQILIRLIYANCPNDYEVDHDKPLSKGGSHAPDNLQYLPIRINRQKCNHDDFDVSQYVLHWQDILDTALNDHPLVGVGTSVSKCVESSKKDYDMVWSIEKSVAA